MTNNTNLITFARQCDATGKGMNEGYCFLEGEMYFSEEKYLIAHLRGLEWEDCNGENSKDIESDSDLLEFFYDEDVYYYTEWEQDDHQYYLDPEGNLQELEG